MPCTAVSSKVIGSSVGDIALISDIGLMSYIGRRVETRHVNIPFFECVGSSTLTSASHGGAAC
jgi:hypothetical protein